MRTSPLQLLIFSVHWSNPEGRTEPHFGQCQNLLREIKQLGAENKGDQMRCLINPTAGQTAGQPSTGGSGADSQLQLEDKGGSQMYYGSGGCRETVSKWMAFERGGAYNKSSYITSADRIEEQEPYGANATATARSSSDPGKPTEQTTTSSLSRKILREENGMGTCGGRGWRRQLQGGLEIFGRGRGRWKQELIREIRGRGNEEVRGIGGAGVVPEGIAGVEGCSGDAAPNFCGVGCHQTRLPYYVC